MVDEGSENELTPEQLAQLRAIASPRVDARERAIAASLEAFDEEQESKKISRLRHPNTFQKFMGVAAVLVLFAVVFAVISGGNSTSNKFSAVSTSLDGGFATGAKQSNDVSSFQERGVIHSIDELTIVLNDRNFQYQGTEPVPCYTKKVQEKYGKLIALTSFDWQPKGKKSVPAVGFRIEDDTLHDHFLVVNQNTCEVLAHRYYS
jgi:hypothetical protein